MGNNFHKNFLKKSFRKSCAKAIKTYVKRILDMAFKTSSGEDLQNEPKYDSVHLSKPESQDVEGIHLCVIDSLM